VCAALLFSAIAAPAAAADKVAVFPVSVRKLPKWAVKLPKVLGARVRALVEEAGDEVVVPAVALSDAKVVVGCSAFDSGCATKTAVMLSVDRVIVGTMIGVPGKVKIVLRIWSSEGGLVSEVIKTLPAKPLVMKAKVPPLADELFGVTDEPPEPVEAPLEPVEALPEPAAPEPVVAPLVPDTPKKKGSAKISVPGIVVGAAGVLLAASSIIAYSRARKFGVDFEAAPQDTIEDIDNALGIRSKGRTLAGLTIGLLAAGGAAVAVGATLVVLDLTASGKDKDASSARPALVVGFDGGPSVKLRVRFGGAMP